MSVILGCLPESVILILYSLKFYVSSKDSQVVLFYDSMPQMVFDSQNSCFYMATVLAHESRSP